MDIVIKNCNNIDYGRINIERNALNIKYAINGTGKSTIAKAIACQVQDQNKLSTLLPLKHYKEKNGHEPSVDLSEPINSIKIFNEDYVRNFVFIEDDVIKNSFEVFIKDENYENHEKKIAELFCSVRKIFEESDEAKRLLEVLQNFIDNYKATKKGYSGAGALGKGLAKGNKLAAIPEELQVYESFFKNENVVPWLKWQLDGEKFLEVGTCCPYCSSSKIAEKKETIKKVKETYEPNYVNNLIKMLVVIDSLSDFLSNDAKNAIQGIRNNVAELMPEQKNFLQSVYDEIITLKTKLEEIKSLSFVTLKDVDDVEKILNSKIIKKECFSKLKSNSIENSIDIINGEIKNVLDNAGRLKGEIKQQKMAIAKKMKEKGSEINEFLQYAGYAYEVHFLENDNYRMILKHIECDSEICKGNHNLSYGEKNAFALILFMYDALRENPDLIVLDDPISSFDENKKFAILYKLFLNGNNLQNKTVLLLSHDFNVVIDCVYNFAGEFHPNASFLENNSSQLTEKSITKKDITSYKQIALQNIEEKDVVIAIIYLRRLFEFEGEKNMGYQLLSNLIHKREIPLMQEEKPLSSEELEDGITQIKKYLPDFDYDDSVSRLRNNAEMLCKYKSLSNSYEKIQIYRIMREKNPEKNVFKPTYLIENENRVVKKFIDETFHIENDYLFQLNPVVYNTIPDKIIEFCDNYVDEINAKIESIGGDDVHA